MWLIIQTHPLLSETHYDFKDGMFRVMMQKQENMIKQNGLIK